MAELTKGEGSVGILQGQIGTTPEIDRNNGFDQALKENPGLQVVAKQPADWDQDKGFNIAQNMLQAHPDISVFFGRADAMALGAAQAVRVANVDHDVTIVGFDGDVAGLKAVARRHDRRHHDPADAAHGPDGRAERAARWSRARGPDSSSCCRRS